ncbi:TPA: NERD domain-containing protein [Clostridioides difficile]|nr:NERD domain-containing protein [Clostridioides difficile]MDV9711758.1 nuclease-related domain-containing protein [Clostridioides difficile]HDO9658078.1 NERD domain-containing protein [Clostridioides difficile]
MKEVIKINLEQIENIENSIINSNYDDFLDKHIQDLIKYLEQYRSEDILKLFNCMIFYHNCNMYFKEKNYKEYNKSMHISLNLMLHIHELYYENINVFGRKKIDDYKQEIQKLASYLKNIENIYYYYPLKNYSKLIEIGLNEQHLFYLDYFRTYFFDLPSISLEQYVSFFKENKEICKTVLKDNNFEENFNMIILLLGNIEDIILMSDNILIKFLKNLYLNNSNYYLKNISKGLWVKFPIIIMKIIFKVEGIHFKDFTEAYFYKLERNKVLKKYDLLNILLNNNSKIGLISKKSMYLPRNFYVLHKLYKKVWMSKEIGKDNSQGHTYKSMLHEKKAYELLSNVFGKNNVYKNIFLKIDKKYIEKDFIVLCNNYILTIEAKSKVLPEAKLDFQDGIESIRKKFDQSINEAYRQCSEVKDAIKKNDAIFYNTNSKPRKKVLDLSDKESKNVIEIVLLFEEFINIETNPNIFWNSNNTKVEYPWVIDIETLKEILNDTVKKDNLNLFIKYVRLRTNMYSSLSVSNGEELKVFNLYKSMPFVYDTNVKDKNISIHI